MKTFIKVHLIQKYLKEHKISKTEFCRRVGVSIGVFNKILLDKWNFRVEAIVKIANYIGTDTIFDDTYFD